ncbi:MAG: hypothetical protein JNK82_41835 [Myxococcaceae bacterium]|nr:hypothetical protein [Myxococcaceae bacterium]
MRAQRPRMWPANSSTVRRPDEQRGPTRHTGGLLAVIAVFVASAALAGELEPADAFQTELEEARANVAAQLQLQAYDLLDELAYRWAEEPPFEKDTAVVLADVSVPVGFGSGLQALLENHFVTLMVKNPRTHVQLVHCPQCTAMVVHSGAKGTVVGRGVDMPEALAAAGVASGSRHAIFLDFEAEGSVLVLRVRMTSLEPKLPITYAHTLSTTTTSAAMLRSPDKLKSAAEARKEYLELLEGKGLLLIPLTVTVRTYQTRPGSFIAAQPLVFVQAGVEASLSQARAWTVGANLGITWTPDTSVGWSIQGRISRLITGNTVSLTRPDVYAFIGGALIGIYGAGALGLKNQVPTIADIRDATQTNPSHYYGTFQAGLLMRLKNRIGASFYIESAPGLDNANAVGNFVDLGFMKWHTFGFEVSFCF